LQRLHDQPGHLGVVGIAAPGAVQPDPQSVTVSLDQDGWGSIGIRHEQMIMVCIIFGQ
jgi:hypothetical protein